MPSTNPKRILRAALFDALKAAADKFGGIGAGTFYTDYNQNRAAPTQPHCVIGFLHHLGLAQLAPEQQNDIINLHGVGTDKAAELLGFTWATNDSAVQAINEALGTLPEKRFTPTSKYPRVPFTKWAEYLNIQRAVELPAKVYDALKASAEKYGGIGRHYLYSVLDSVEVPCCILGHTEELDGLDSSIEGGPVTDALKAALGADWLRVGSTNDRALEAINTRKGVPLNTRVTFDEWADELNVVRVAVLAPNVYDALEASAAKFGGIGADAFDSTSYTADDRGVQVPYCVAGHAVFHDTHGADTVPDVDSPTLVALQEAFNVPFYYKVYDVNDAAVFAINERKGVDVTARVSFAEWTKELYVVRGDA